MVDRDVSELQYTLAYYVSKVISGGQSGADVAGLRAAKARGLATGGMMPRGWRTLGPDGRNVPRPEYAALYGMREAYSANYAFRTEANVRDSDVTVRIARDFESAGERCTLRAIRNLDRPHIDILVRDEHLAAGRGSRDDAERAAFVIRAIRKRAGRPLVINVAGNSDRTARGLERVAEDLFGMTLDALPVVE
jgi:hypothetical protein